MQANIIGWILHMISNFDFPSCITVVCDVQLIFSWLMTWWVVHANSEWFLAYFQTRELEVCGDNVRLVQSSLWPKKFSPPPSSSLPSITIIIILVDLKIARETASSFSNPPPPRPHRYFENDENYLQVFSSDRDVPAWSRFSPGRLWWPNCQIAILGPL